MKKTFIAALTSLLAVMLLVACNNNDAANNTPGSTSADDNQTNNQDSNNTVTTDNAVSDAANNTASDNDANTKSPIISDNPHVLFSTSAGDIVIELFEKQAPVSTKNFLTYAEQGFYDNTIFHRVIASFVIQGGGFTADMQRKQTNPPIKNEADNGLKNTRGTLSMARTSDPSSATSQFFINVKDNPNLDHRGKNQAGWGYAVFGRVVDGMDVVDTIRVVPTGFKQGMGDVPLEPITVNNAKILQR